METTDTMEQAVNSLLAIEPDQEVETDEVETEETEEVEVEGAQADDAETDEVDKDGDEPEEDEDGEETDDLKNFEKIMRAMNSHNISIGPDGELVHKVKVDGEYTEVNFNDLTRSYSGQAYIQKGMQQAAEARKEAEGLYHTLQSERQQFLATVQQLQQQGIVTPPKAPDMSMLDSDPIGYMQEKAAYDVKIQEYQNQQRQIQMEQARQQQLQESARQVAMQEQAKMLEEKIPEFANPDTAATLKRALLEHGTSYGLSAEEIAGIADARYVQVLYDAYKYRQLQSGTAKAKKQLEPPRNVKPKPRRAEPQKLVQKRKMQAARKSGKPEAFIDLLLE